MSSEPPEYHTKTLSPLSPLPVHPPEPSNIPVLRNQIDPVFNMTSTHLDPKSSDPNVIVPITVPDAAAQGDSASDSSFSDAYRDSASKEESKVEEASSSSEASDDYAMTFDSDGEEQEDNPIISQANTATETTDQAVSLQNSDLPSHGAAHDATATQAGPDQSAPSNLTPDPPVTTDNPPPSLPDNLSPKVPNDEDMLEASKNDETQIGSDTAQAPLYDDVANGGIDIQQLLDNITANAEKNEASTPTQTINTSLPKPSMGLPPHASLPPRPQVPQMRPFQDDIQKYHNTAPGVPQNQTSYRPPGISTSIVAAGAPGTSTDPRGGLPPPPSANFHAPPNQVSPISPASYSQINQSSGQVHLAKSIESRDEADDIDQRWGPDVQKLYDIFLDEERMYVTEGLWDRFPVGSRLFIGNLPSEKVTKRDLFHVFHKYGRLAQVSIKQAYGFIQFHDSAACYQALKCEQGCEVRGRKMHLEISKPQKNSKNAQQIANAAPLRRSRSPDYNRGGMAGRQGRNVNNGYDRSQPSVRVDEYGRVLRSPVRGRDDYRPQRSISPLRPNTRGEREYFEARGRDAYGRDRGRDRSRSPYGQRDNGRYRERSLSPRRREANADADLQIPRREPRDVPDVQIILMEQLDRAFVSWVEGEIGGRGVRTEVMFLSSRLPLDAVIRRQILEGVHAVVKLDLMAQNSSKIPLQVFDRQHGADNVRWDEYRDLDPKIAAELVLRAKQTQPQPVAPQYSQPQYNPPQPYQPQAYQLPPQQTAPNVANLVGQLDNATLQKLLGTLNMPQQQNPQAVAANSAIDLASLLGGLQQQQAPPPQQSAYQPPPAAQYANQPINAALAAYLGNAAASQPAPMQGQQSAQQVQNIMAQLAKYRQ